MNKRNEAARFMTRLRQTIKACMSAKQQDRWLFVRRCADWSSAHEAHIEMRQWSERDFGPYIRISTGVDHLLDREQRADIWREMDRVIELALWKEGLTFKGGNGHFQVKL
jgi:hypothetical protein